MAVGRQLQLRPSSFAFTRQIGSSQRCTCRARPAASPRPPRPSRAASRQRSRVSGADLPARVVDADHVGSAAGPSSTRPARSGARAGWPGARTAPSRRGGLSARFWRTRAPPPARSARRRNGFVFFRWTGGALALFVGQHGRVFQTGNQNRLRPGNKTPGNRDFRGLFPGLFPGFTWDVLGRP